MTRGSWPAVPDDRHVTCSGNQQPDVVSTGAALLRGFGGVAAGGQVEIDAWPIVDRRDSSGGHAWAPIGSGADSSDGTAGAGGAAATARSVSE